MEFGIRCAIRLHLAAILLRVSVLGVRARPQGCAPVLCLRFRRVCWGDSGGTLASMDG